MRHLRRRATASAAHSAGGEHKDATLNAEIEAIKEAVHVPFVFAGFAISDWEEERIHLLTN